MNLASYQPSRAWKLETAPTSMENLKAALRKIVITYNLHVSCGFVDPTGRVGPRPLACWIVFEFRRGHGFFFLLCDVRCNSPERTDHSSRGVLPNVVYLSVIVKPR